MRNLGGFFMSAVQGLPVLESYQKPALSFEQQLQKLINRGLVVDDPSRALSRLTTISYYRLSAYWYPFRVHNKDHALTHAFKPNTRFEDVVLLYDTDRKLRSLVLDAIEYIEIAVRTRFTYHIGQQYGAFGHTHERHFHPQFNHRVWLNKLDDEVRRAKDDFILHYRAKYAGFPTLPIWMLTEVMSLGALSFGYNGLINNQKQGVEDKKAIAQQFNLHHKKLGDWLHTLTYVRNICAHHSRLWNRNLAIRPDKTKEAVWRAPLTPRNDRLFYILLMLRHLLREIGAGKEWAMQINQLLEPLAQTPQWRLSMGMPENWREHPIWK